MNTPDNANATEHLRYEIAQLDKMRQQIFSDMEALRQQEQNLRSYESRLRGAPPPTGTTIAPFTGGSREIDAEREKLSRQRALLEAERRSLADDRIALREERTALAQYAEALKKREAWLEVQERELKARAFAPPPAPVKKPASVAPFGLRLGLNEVPFSGIFGSNRRSA
ncbi:MAG: hypothetical protein HZA32_11480 [Opitutae bacterium]|nr:hypothetical protein [Opitutae bacterium]